MYVWSFSVPSFSLTFTLTVTCMWGILQYMQFMSRRHQQMKLVWQSPLLSWGFNVLSTGWSMLSAPAVWYRHPNQQEHYPFVSHQLKHEHECIWHVGMELENTENIKQKSIMTIPLFCHYLCLVMYMSYYKTYI